MTTPDCTWMKSMSSPTLHGETLSILYDKTAGDYATIRLSVLLL